MNFLLDVAHSIGGLLRKPGDKFSAEITPSGNQVIKLVRDGKKRSAVKYKTGTVVETIVHRGTDK
jgi:hypothetical protein